jgi:hypothetical protein
MQQQLVKFNAIITSGLFIGTGEDFEFNWEPVMPTQILDILHIDNYTPSGIEVGYQANWLNEMKTVKRLKIQD